MSTKRRTFKRPSWLWRGHHMLSALVIFAGLGMAVAALQYSTVKFPASATLADNIYGWLWSDSASWISMNDQNPNGCNGPCGSYGVRVNADRTINGWAWSDNLGWVCFGSFCSHAACQNDPGDPSGLVNAPNGASPTASVDAGSGILQVRGWAKVCAAHSKGWIALNCQDAPGGCANGYAYKVVYNTATKAFYSGSHPQAPAFTPNYSSLGWNGFNDGTGLGYVDFQYASMNAPAESLCADGLDNDFNGKVDCLDASCSANPSCNGEGPAFNNCFDGLDNNVPVNSLIDCQEPSCKAGFPVQCPNVIESTANGNCANGVDDDVDGVADCADAKCSSAPNCAQNPNGPESMCKVNGQPAGTLTCCSNKVDDDGNGGVDCADLDCQAKEPSCTPAWLSTQYGNVYAQQGIIGSEQKKSSATYCLTTQGTIQGFTSGQTCLEAQNDQTLTLPKDTSSYQGTLGSLDIKGILNGRYGQVVKLAGGTGVDLSPLLGQTGSLDGKVYYVSGDATLGNSVVDKLFKNGTTSSGKGNGLLIVEGDLYIKGNLKYESPVGVGYLRNLASFGVIVKKVRPGVGGKILISPNVTNLVGAYFAEDSVSTGTSCPAGQQSCPAEVPLTISGLVASRLFDFQRNYHDENIPAEQVNFDGRAVANPPPGMQDLSKSLPTSKDAF